MNVYCSSGIVLHSMKYSENKLIVHIFTASNGRRSYITTITRRGAGRNLFQPLFIIDFTAVAGKGEMHKLSQVSATIPLVNMPYDITKSSISIFISEVLYRIIKDEFADVRLFEFVQSSIIALDLTTESVANFHLHFMVRLSHYLGFAPQGRHLGGAWFDIKKGEYVGTRPNHTLVINPQQSELMNRLTHCPTSELHTIRLSREERTAFLDTMVDFYGYHSESIFSVNSISIFREIF